MILPVNTLHETGIDSGGRSVSREDQASSVGHTQILHVEVNDVMTWVKMNIVIGRTFFVNSLYKSAIVNL